MDVRKMMEQLPQCDEKSAGTVINMIADEFRRGGDLRQLRPLLTHSDVNIAGAGAWIVAEVADRNRGHEILNELRALAVHPDPSVRFQVVSSLPWIVRPEDADTAWMVFLALDDEDAGVRRNALAQVCALPDDIIQGMYDTSEWAVVRVLARGASKEHVRALLSSSKRIVRRLALAGAIRNYAHDSAFIAELVPMLDDEVVEGIGDLLYCRRL